jgi:hypothetical protein
MANLWQLGGEIGQRDMRREGALRKREVILALF